MNTFEQPVVKPARSSVAEMVETHPAYASITASRVSGRGVLFGSDFKHQHYIVLRINKAELYRGLNNDHVHPGKELIEVAMTEAQWATFITNMNTAVGSPCTLERHNGDLIPRIPEPPQRKKQFQDEFRKSLEDVKVRLSELVEMVEGLKLSDKQKNNLLVQIDRIKISYMNNLEFVADQFGEHVERTSERAKIELTTYVTNLLQRAGLSALATDIPLQLGE